METNRLEMFVVLVEEGNYRLAAERLGISQPALSQQISRIEADLGAQLIDRKTRPLSMTEVGKEFYSSCLSILDSVETINRLANDVSQGKIGRIRIGMVISMLYGKLPGYIRKFRSANPNIEIEIIYNTTVKLIEHMQNGRLDVLFLLTNPKLSDVTSTHLYSEPYYIGVPDDHPKVSSAEFNFADLKDDPIILPPRHVAPENYDNLLVACQEAGFSPNFLNYPGSYLDHIGLVAAGLGVCFVPKSLENTNISGSEIKALVNPVVKAKASVSWFPSRTDPAITSFITGAVKYYKDLGLADE